MSKWIRKKDRLPPPDGEPLWAYYPHGMFGSSKEGRVEYVSRGNEYMMFYLDEGSWKGLGSAGDKYTHWQPVKITKPRSPKEIT